MSAMHSLGNDVAQALSVVAARVPAAQQLNPDDVRPGKLALVVFLAMAAATALLLRSFVKQTRRIDFDDGVERGPDGRPVPPVPPRAPRPTPDDATDDAAADDDAADGQDPDPPAPR